MNRKMMAQLMRGLLIFLFLVGCTESIPTITLTINENKCTLEGPTAVPYGEFRIKLVIIEKIPTESGYALSTLDEGKTLDDLKAWTSVDQPPWLYVVDGVHEMNGGSHTYSYDLTQEGKFQSGPLYLVCFRTNPDTRNLEGIGEFGPIEVRSAFYQP